MQIEEALNLIQEEIANFHGDTGPGHFEALVWNRRGNKYPALGYFYVIPERDDDEDPLTAWPLPGPEWEASDDPWKRWGGDQIAAAIETRGLRFRDGDLENFRDKWGRDVYSDIAVFDYEGSDDE